jgi:hypothetical protein
VDRVRQEPGERRRCQHPAPPRDVDGHHAHAVAEGAQIEKAPEDQFYGDRSYIAIDLEGHRWTFSTKVREVSREEAEKALGQPIMATNWQ